MTSSGTSQYAESVEAWAEALDAQNDVLRLVLHTDQDSFVPHGAVVKAPVEERLTCTTGDSLR